MQMIQKLSERFDQLFDEIKQIEATHGKQNSQLTGTIDVIDNEKTLTWKVKSKSLLVTTCGKDSQHYEEFIKAEKLRSYETQWNAFKRMKSVFIAAMDDYKNGYLTSLKNLIQAEVFDSELEQAQELLSSGYKLAAAVIAGVVLETTLRDICLQNNLALGKLDKMNADLAKAGIYNKLQQKRITALADIRNSAAHGKPEEFSDDDVIMMIRDIEQFLAIYLA